MQWEKEGKESINGDFICLAIRAVNKVYCCGLVYVKKCYESADAIGDLSINVTVQPDHVITSGASPK